ncbi:uncharacterized protein V6R79_016079 [Siganus canaliculatus]
MNSKRFSLEQFQMMENELRLEKMKNNCLERQLVKTIAEKAETERRVSEQTRSLFFFGERLAVKMNESKYNQKKYQKLEHEREEIVEFLVEVWEKLADLIADEHWKLYVVQKVKQLRYKLDGQIMKMQRRQPSMIEQQRIDAEKFRKRSHQFVYNLLGKTQKCDRQQDVIMGKEDLQFELEFEKLEKLLIQRHCDKLKEKLQAKEPTANRDLVNQSIEDLIEEELARLELEQKCERAETSDIQKQNDKPLQKLQEKNEDLKNQLKASAEKIEILQMEVEFERQQKLLIQEQLEGLHYQQLLDENKDLKYQLQESAEKIDLLEFEINENSVIHEENEDLKNQLQAAADKIDALQFEVECGREETLATQKGYGGLQQQLYEENKDLKNQLEAAVEKIDGLQLKVEFEKQEKSTIQKQVGQLQQQLQEVNKNLENQLEVSAKALDGLPFEVDCEKKEKSTIQEQVGQLQQLLEENRDLKNQLEAAAEKIDDLKFEMDFERQKFTIQQQHGQLQQKDEEDLDKHLQMCLNLELSKNEIECNEAQQPSEPEGQQQQETQPVQQESTSGAAVPKVPEKQRPRKTSFRERLYIFLGLKKKKKDTVSHNTGTHTFTPKTPLSPRKWFSRHRI